MPTVSQEGCQKTQVNMPVKRGERVGGGGGGGRKKGRQNIYGREGGCYLLLT